MDCVDQDENKQHQQQQKQQQQQTNPMFKHYCRVCKKGFMCGRALGGHMRAHGIGDESANVDDDEDEDQGSDWEEKGERTISNSNNNNKRMYKLRTNPNRLKSVRVCENCGQEFFSWKSFLEHGKCGSDDDDGESLVSSPGGSEADESIGRRGHGWSKRKRSLRAKVGSCSTLSSEDEDLLFAKCLVDLANARVFPAPVTATTEAADAEEESCASASKDDERRNPAGEFLARAVAKANKLTASSSNGSKGLFECKACKKVFTSHQALGGHRASHKKVKGCYAAKQDLQDNDSLAEDDVITHEEFPPSSKTSSYQYEACRRKSKVHECSICHRVFSTGQALGGHKRCHWITSNSYSPDTSISKFHFHDHKSSATAAVATATVVGGGGSATLDLNLPAGGDRMTVEVSTEIHLHPWYMSSDPKETEPKKANNKVAINGGTQQIVDDDEADSKLKFARISGLKETSTSKGNSSQWLQVGIGSAPTNVGPD